MSTRIGFCLLYAGFLLGVLLKPEDGAGMLLRKSVDFQLTTGRYIPEKKLIISTVVRISNPTIYISFLQYSLYAPVI
jgi:hypothetical protein